MRIETLLAFLGAPDLNAVPGEPFHHERRFVLAASQTVEHEDQKNIELFQSGGFLNFPDGVPVLCRDFEAGNALLAELPDDFPSLIRGEIPAAFFLHGNVVFLHLAFRGDAV